MISLSCRGSRLSVSQVVVFPSAPFLRDRAQEPDPGANRPKKYIGGKLRSRAIKRVLDLRRHGGGGDASPPQVEVNDHSSASRAEDGRPAKDSQVLLFLRRMFVR